MPFLEISGLRKRFGALEILKGIDLTLDKGVAYNLLGDKDQALKALAVYVAANPSVAKDLNSDNNWMWRNLRDDPRFQALAKSSK